MAKLERVKGKIFGLSADPTGNDPAIGQFGSAKAGTYIGTGNVEQIQALSAWDNGWIDAVTATQQFPTLPEMTGVHKVLSYQNAYILQKGVPEWNNETDYYKNDFCSRGNTIYYSLIDGNIGYDPSLPSSSNMWAEYAASAIKERYTPFSINYANTNVSGEADLIVAPDVTTIEESQINEVQVIPNISHDVNTEDLIQGVDIRGNVFGEEVGKGRYVISNYFTNKISGQTGQPYGATSYTYTFSTPLPAGTYRILFCKMENYTASYSLYMTYDGSEHQITVPAQNTLSSTEWTESADITVTTSLSSIRAYTSRAKNTCVPAIRLIKKVTRSAPDQNTLYFKVGGSYRNIIATNSKYITYEVPVIEPFTLSSTAHTVTDNYKNIILNDNFTATTAVDTVTNLILDGESSIMLRSWGGNESPYIQIHGDTAFKLLTWTFANQYNQALNGYSPTSWTVSGSNNGTTWTEIDTLSTGIVEGELFRWEINSSTAYKYYKFEGAGQSGGNDDSVLSINFTSFTATYDYSRTDTDGKYNVLLNIDGTVSVWKNNIYRQKEEPVGNINDIWYDLSVEYYRAYRYNGSSWQEYEGVPLGSCEFESDTLLTVSTYDYNIATFPLKEVYPVIQTYRDDTSWYRIYSDGWCEMGGYTTSSSSNTQQTVNFLKTFTDTNYNISATQAFYSSTYNANLTIVSNTTSSMIVLGQQTGFYWTACGYLAEGQY